MSSPITSKLLEEEPDIADLLTDFVRSHPRLMEEIRRFYRLL